MSLQSQTQPPSTPIKVGSNVDIPSHRFEKVQLTPTSTESSPGPLLRWGIFSFIERIIYVFAFDLLIYKRCEARESPGCAVLGKGRLSLFSPFGFLYRGSRLQSLTPRSPGRLHCPQGQARQTEGRAPLPCLGLFLTWLQIMGF